MPHGTPCAGAVARSAGARRGGSSGRAGFRSAARMTSAGIRYSNIDPDHEIERRARLRPASWARPSRNQCDAGTSPLAMATKLARRASEASRSYRAGVERAIRDAIPDGEQLARLVIRGSSKSMASNSIVRAVRAISSSARDRAPAASPDRLDGLDDACRRGRRPAPTPARRPGGRRGDERVGSRAARRGAGRQLAERRDREPQARHRRAGGEHPSGMPAAASSEQALPRAPAPRGRG